LEPIAAAAAEPAAAAAGPEKSPNSSELLRLDLELMEKLFKFSMILSVALTDLTGRIAVGVGGAYTPLAAEEEALKTTESAVVSGVGIISLTSAATNSAKSSSSSSGSRKSLKAAYLSPLPLSPLVAGRSEAADSGVGRRGLGLTEC